MSAVIDVSDRRFISRPWSAATDPTVTNDVTKGVQVGDTWLNTASGNIFDAVVVTAGAAVWRPRVRHWASIAAATALTGGTSEVAAATQSFAGGMMGINGSLVIEAGWLVNNDASAKTARVRIGAADAALTGTAMRASALANLVCIYERYRIKNINAQNVQKAFNTSGGTFGIGSGGADSATAAIDTSAAFEIVFSGQLADGADSIQLLQWHITLERPDIGP